MRHLPGNPRPGSGYARVGSGSGSGFPDPLNDPGYSLAFAETINHEPGNRTLGELIEETMVHSNCNSLSNSMTLFLDYTPFIVVYTIGLLMLV